MLLFLILSASVISLIVFAVFIAGIFGAAFTIVFSDIIVCIAIFAAIIYFVRRKKKSNN